jgi:hypothetical protein
LLQAAVVVLLLQEVSITVALVVLVDLERQLHFCLPKEQLTLLLLVVVGRQLLMVQILFFHQLLLLAVAKAGLVHLIQQV